MLCSVNSVLRDESLPQNSQRMGEIFRGGLQDLAEERPDLIETVRALHFIAQHGEHQSRAFAFAHCPWTNC